MFLSEAFKRAQRGIMYTGDSVERQMDNKCGCNRKSILIEHTFLALLSTVGAGSISKGGKDATQAEFVLLCDKIQSSAWSSLVGPVKRWMLKEPSKANLKTLIG